MLLFGDLVIGACLCVRFGLLGLVTYLAFDLCTLVGVFVRF